MPISVACACGVRLKTKDENAGRSLRCPKCGQMIAVPSAGPVTRPPVAAARQTRAAEPVPADLYGLDDLPAPAASSGARDEGPFAQTAASTEEKLPPRAGYAPMSEAKKKKIAKRAAKVDKSKPSYAGASVGISLGAVLAIALFGWRLYRVTHGVARVLNHVNASAKDDPATEKAIAAEVSRAVEQMVNDPTTAEAREWLDAAKHPKHVVFEMGNDRAREMVAGFYDRGAERVYVLEPSTIEGAVVTAEFAVKLPTDPAKRKECLAFAAPYLEEDGPIADEGQKYLVISTD